MDNLDRTRSSRTEKTTHTRLKGRQLDTIGLSASPKEAIRVSFQVRPLVDEMGVDAEAIVLRCESDG